MDKKTGGESRDLSTEALNVKPGDLTDIRKPICVDLDGTLINTDLLIEGLLAIISRRGLADLHVLVAGSRADFKRKVGMLADLTPEFLPYNSEVLNFLRAQRQLGRPIVLATAADARAAQAVADHLGVFGEVIASDGVRNLKGEVKARELVRRFGHKGFDYVGNDRADLAVWRAADRIVVVNAPWRVSKAARTIGNVMAEITNRPPLLSTAVRAMRPHQWVKNLLVFVPLLASQSLHDVAGWLSALCMFASFCATASGIYLVNDLLDLDADRRHPRKRQRPFASGAMSLQFGTALAGVLIAAGIGLSFVVEAELLLFLYAAVSLLYSAVLKRFPVLDVFVLASLYTVRIVAGGVASHHPITLWLLGFSGFTFLSLAFVKRTGEIVHIVRSTQERGISRRGYSPEDHAILQMFGCASAFASSVVLALFVNSSAAFQQYRTPELLWALVPLVLFWQCRIWLSTSRGQMHDDPIVYASRDRVSWLVAASVLVVMMLAAWFPA